jgi:hypothetical protein
VPEFAAAQIVAVFGFLRRGDQDRTTNDVRALTGRDPSSLARFAYGHAVIFRHAGEVGAESMPGAARNAGGSGSWTVTVRDNGAPSTVTVEALCVDFPPLR